MGKVTGVITPTTGVMDPYFQLAGASLVHLSLIQPLKNDVWKTILSFWDGTFSGRTVKLREYVGLIGSRPLVYDMLCLLALLGDDRGNVPSSCRIPGAQNEGFEGQQVACFCPCFFS